MCLKRAKFFPMGRILVSMWCSQVSQQLIGPLNEHNFSRASPNCKVPEQVHMNASQPLPWSFHMSPQKGWRWCWHFECVIFQMVDSFFIIGFVAMFLYRSVFRRVTTSRLWTLNEVLAEPLAMGEIIQNSAMKETDFSLWFWECFICRIYIHKSIDIYSY